MINVLPQEEKDILRKDYWMRFTSITLSLFSIMSALAIALVLPSYFFSQTKESIAETRLEAFNLANPGASARDLESIISGINNKLTLLNSDDKSINVSDKIFNEIFAKKSQGITFSQMLYSRSQDKGDALELHGVASDRASLRSFKSALENDSNITSIDLPISSFLGKSNINFTMTIIFK